MRVMVIVKANQESEAGQMPSAEVIAEMNKFNDQLAKAGVLVGMGGLQASSKGKRMRFSGNTRTVIDGPFAETKELIGGYWIWEVASMEEAVEWLGRCPNPDSLMDGELEIRPIYADGECGAGRTPELKATAAE